MAGFFELQAVSRKLQVKAGAALAGFFELQAVSRKLQVKAGAALAGFFLWLVACGLWLVA